MTNIRTSGMFPSELSENHDFVNPSSLKMLLDLRRETHQGFANIEKDKGLLKPEMSLSSTHGQEAVRILLMRAIEELVEAYSSIGRDHYLEELIDAINYFWSLIIIDPNAPLDQIIEIMVNQQMDHVSAQVPRISNTDIGNVVVEMNPLLEKLRHRSWMQHSQDPYFSGWLEIANFLGVIFTLVLDQFESYVEFVSFYIAKDNVLKFRLETKY